MQETVTGRRVFNPLNTLSAFLLLVFTCIGAAQAQVVIAPSTPQVGSSNPVTAEPPIAVPNVKPCTVSLFTNAAFDSFNATTFNYAPPAGCHGPWSKVVLTADFTVSAGNQFDRSAWFYLGDINLFFGSTAEPRNNLSPSWHIERDVTDLTSVLKTAQPGSATIGNTVNSVDNSTIFASAKLEFFPATPFSPAPATPDMVVGLSSGSDPLDLVTATDQLSQTVNLPRNVESVYLDVFAQNQIDDEFYYLCTPNNLVGSPESECGNTAFRETEISIDGKPAGVAPVFPFFFTGGLDPDLWEPIPGVQTLNFKPYRVDLTPFAGVLGDGSQHTVAISVFNANDFFNATANLLVFTDHGSHQVTGGLISNTLSAAPVPQIKENLTTNSSGIITGTVSVGSNRNFSISGFVNTSHGRVVTTVQQQVNFLNTQTYNVNPVGSFVENVVQASTVDSQTTTQQGVLRQTVSKHVSYPLTVVFSEIANPDGTFNEVTSVNQQNLQSDTKALDGFPLFESNTQEQVISMDTLPLSAQGAPTAAGTGNSSASFQSNDSLGHCFSRSLTAKDQVLTNVTDGKGCQQRKPF
jgi:hypothetical protein